MKKTNKSKETKQMKILFFNIFDKKNPIFLQLLFPQIEN
jgi:hypothetical protein